MAKDFTNMKTGRVYGAIAARASRETQARRSRRNGRQT